MKTIKEKLSRFILPMLLGVSIMSSILYDYTSADIMLLTLASFALELVVFFTLDALYHAKHKAIGGFVYFLMLAADLYIMVSLIYAGYQSKYIMFNLWFYGATEQVYEYLYAVVFCGGFLMYSVLYYFTQVRYRGLFTLLLVLFPFAIYAKRLDYMNSWYLAAILVCYLLVMVHSRQTAADSGVVVVPDRSYLASIAVFAGAVIGLLFILPVPEIESMQEKDAEFLNNISLFSGAVSPDAIDIKDSSSRHHGDMPTGTELFRVYNDDDIYLKIQSFGIYQDNDWLTGADTIEEAGNVWTKPDETVKGMSIVNKMTVLRAYCEKTGDTEKNAIIDDFLDKIAVSEMNIGASGTYMFRTYALPEGTLNADGMSSDFVTYLGTDYQVYCNGEWVPKKMVSDYHVRYYDNYAIRQLSEELGMTTADWDTIMGWCNVNSYDDENGDAMFDRSFYRSVNSDRSMAQLIDGGEYDEYDDSIRELALEITEGCVTDYEKAVALESYFENAEYIYDLSYIPDDESIEYFIFESKTGICSDFATAMTLMARSIGLTARYCEGYIALEKDDEYVGDTNCYIVRDTYAHAFVEIYLPACGWVIFEPTVSSFEETMLSFRGGDNNKVGGLITRTGVYVALCVMIVLAIVLLILFRPICELMFRIYACHVSREKGIKKLYARLVRKLAKRTDTSLSAYTSQQVCEYAVLYGFDISELVSAFERSFYGGIDITDEEFENALAQYKAVCDYRIIDNRLKRC